LDYFIVVLQLIFYFLFLVTLARFLRRPTRLDLAVVAVFGSTAALFGYSLLTSVYPSLSAPLRPVAVGALLVQPVLIIWMVGLIESVPRWVLPVVFAGFVIAFAGILAFPPRTAWVSIFVAVYFIGGEGAGGVLLALGSRRRYGLARLRLVLAGIGSALFGACIFIAAIGSTAAGSGPTNEIVTISSRIVAILAALAFVAAFATPRGLRNVGTRAVAFDLARDLVGGPSGTDPAVLWRSLALAARDILGARSVRIRAGTQVLASTEVEPADDQAAAVEGSGDPAASRSVDQAQPARRHRRHLVEMPLATAEDAPHLTADIDGLPLFIEDDIAAVRLLGSMTIRSVEREEAVIHLAEARRELEAAANMRASEARFLALLAADPNAVLAVDSAGQVSWATGPTGDVFGKPAAELSGTPVADLVDMAAPELTAVSGTDLPVRRLQATGRRVDGGTFPADVAITPFQLDDLSYQLYVVSDASWRHEANLMRDRFLGILSHELRTPITSIYGGTQLLLKRSDRLDEGTRSELMTNVAAEAERLQRIIENLLILARVERGADFFDARPVTLKAVLTDFVANEQRLWPDMKIDLQVARGVPLVAADEEYLALILRNLLSNAAKYAGEGSTVQLSAVQSAEEGDGPGEVTVRVIDNGPGISEEDTDQLFGLYYRSAMTTATPGAGIGLFVCRGLVEAMGGRIWARHRPEGGAEFGFSLPVYEEQTVSMPRAATFSAIRATATG
jgi:signal transduction histidine kinase